MISLNDIVLIGVIGGERNTKLRRASHSSEQYGEVADLDSYYHRRLISKEAISIMTTRY